LPGWTWDTRADQWEEGFSYLRQYSEREGNCRVPWNHETNEGYRLGGWVNTQRTEKSKMEPDHRRRLEELPGWSWDVRADQFEEYFSRMKEYSEREGHCRVPVSFETDDGYRLGSWVTRQRTRQSNLSVEKRQRLEALPGWSWDARADQWEEGLSYLSQFSKREGHCRVPRNHETNEGYRLGGWVTKQRARRSEMNPDRRQRLEALPGWVWKVEK
jgi:hypothetical protein